MRCFLYGSDYRFGFVKAEFGWGDFGEELFGLGGGDVVEYGWGGDEEGGLAGV